MPTKPTVIRFFAPVIDVTVNTLMTTIDKKMRQGATEFVVLVSSPGGSVFHGLSAYNYLKGLPVSITTHNFGSVDSIGVVLFCAGSKRLSVPQARFLLHGVSAGFRDERLEEPQLEERLKGLKIDIENIAKVIVANTGHPSVPYPCTDYMCVTCARKTLGVSDEDLIQEERATKRKPSFC